MMNRASDIDPFHKNVQREFELRYLRSRGTAFQDFFSDLMEAAFGTDFYRVRPHGVQGDLKSDGYLQSEKTVYQVYGPEDTRNISRLLTKIEDDFNGAKLHWSGQIQRWIFVHNAVNGLPAKAVQKLDWMRTASTAIDVECWGFQQLWDITLTIDRARLHRLFPHLGATNSERDPVVITTNVKELYWRWLSRDLRHKLRILQRADLPTFNTPFRFCSPRDIKTHEQRQGSPKLEQRRPSSNAPKDINLLSLRSVLQKHRRILIEGEAGSGKSTLLRKFARRELVHLLRQRRGARTRGKTPVIIDLRLVDKDHSLEDLTLASIAQACIRFSTTDLRYLQERGYLTFLLDGLDEVPDSQRSLCIHQIERLASDSPHCGIVVTSRRYPCTSLAFTRLSIAPLTNSDIARAFSQTTGSKKKFRQRFNEDPQTYVQHLSSEVLRLCRWPLTLQMILDIVFREGKPPNTLFELYERFVLWRFNWEQSNARVTSLTSYIVAGETLATLVTTQVRAPLMTDWVKALAVQLGEVRNPGSNEHLDSETIANHFLTSGMGINDYGSIRFSHKSFEEFFIAKNILRIASQNMEAPTSPDPAVCRFLCGAVEDFTGLLTEQFDQCKDVIQLLPLLEECKATGREGGRFQDMYDAIFFAQELGVELCYGMYNSREETFVDEVRHFVDTCVGVGPKAIPVLKTAASDILNGTLFIQSEEWFAVVVAGLVTMGWEGASIHRSLSDAGFFTHPERFSIDGSGSASAEARKEANYETLCGYMKALQKDDFATASKNLNILRRRLIRRPRPRRSRFTNRDQKALFTPDT